MCRLKCKVQARRCWEGACMLVLVNKCLCVHGWLIEQAKTWETQSVRWMGDADTRKAKSCSASHCCLCLKPTNPSKKTHTKTLQVPLFLFWWFFCRKRSPRLTKTNKYFIQCIICAVWSTGERERGRPHEGICFEFLMTFLLTLLALLHKEEVHGDSIPRSQHLL